MYGKRFNGHACKRLDATVSNSIVSGSTLSDLTNFIMIIIIIIILIIISFKYPCLEHMLYIIKYADEFLLLVGPFNIDLVREKIGVQMQWGFTIKKGFSSSQFHSETFEHQQVKLFHHLVTFIKF